jgi:hypothetical protein
MKIKNLKDQLERGRAAAYSVTVTNSAEILKAIYGAWTSSLQGLNYIPMVRTPEFRSAYYVGIKNDPNLISTREELSKSFSEFYFDSPMPFYC